MSDEHHVGEDRDTPSLDELRAEEQCDEQQRRDALFSGEYDVEGDTSGIEVTPADVDKSQCRFCRDELDDKSELTNHTCEGMRDARSRAPVEDAPLLETKTHEMGAHLLFEEDDMANYWAIVSGFDNALGKEVCFEAAGDEWMLNHDEDKVKYWEGKIAGRDDDAADALNEYQIGVVADDHVRRKTVNFQFRPALPHPEHCESGKPIQSLPDDLPEGIRVQIDSANVEREDVVDVLQGLANAIDVNPDYFAREKIHDWSRCYNLAEYVRIRRAISEQRITSKNGLFDQMARFSSERDGKGRYEWDNGEIIGHRNTVVMNETACKQYLRGRHGQQAGKLLKSYHMKNPDKTAVRATSHPKLEAQFSTEFSEKFDSIESKHVPWNDDEHFDAADLNEELEEWLMNALH